MQQRQPRLGDVLDDYCPRERRVTNHVVVAMIGDDVKQTRCSTCDADHEYKQAKIPRVRRKTETPAALAAQGFGAPKLHEHAGKPPVQDESAADPNASTNDGDSEPLAPVALDANESRENGEEPVNAGDEDATTETPDEGPVHRRLIRASLPRVEGQAPPTRPNPEFTIRQPNNNRQNRFRPRQGQGRGPMQSNGGNRSFGGGGYPQRQHGGGGNRRRNRSK
jgi:hypothetical protein